MNVKFTIKQLKNMTKSAFKGGREKELEDMIKHLQKKLKNLNTAK